MQQPEIKYFSVDTNTIYPPVLEIKWDDFSYNTGSNPIPVLNERPASVLIAENPGTFYSESINRFRVNSRPEYPSKSMANSFFIILQIMHFLQVHLCGL